MGNYVACKKYTKKVPKGFQIFTSRHLELTAKTYVAIGTGTLQLRITTKSETKTKHIVQLSIVCLIRVTTYKEWLFVEQ